MTTGEVIALIKAFGGSGGGSSGGGVLVVHGTTANGVTTLDKTWQEIADAGFAVYDNAVGEGDHYPLLLTRYYNPVANVYLVYFGENEFGTNAPTGYPYQEESPQ